MPNFWKKPHFLAYLLWPFSLIYWALTVLRTFRYRPEPLPVPVICIGNNTVGGNGKTPMVIFCAALLQKAGFSPHVISRGYKGSFQGTMRVDTSAHTAAEVGDEPLLIAKHAPCWVATRRADAALAAIAEGADCIIMDDGMQNPTIKKDLTLMVVDGTFGFGNRMMIPAGPCREPLEVSLNKAQMLIVMGEAKHKDVASVKQIHPHVFQAVLRVDERNKQRVADQSLIAFAGIGHPEKFFDTLRQCGAHLSATYPFADHHRYRDQELEKLISEAQEKGAALITTEKDWLRLPSVYQEKITYLPVSVAMQREDDLATMMIAAIKERQ